MRRQTFALACTAAFLLPCALGACGEPSASPDLPLAAPGAARSEAGPGFYSPAEGTLHARPGSGPDGLIDVVPSLVREHVTIVTPRTGRLHVQLLAAPVPDTVRLTEAGPGVRVVWEETVRGRALDGGRESHRVAWAFHVTAAADLVTKLLDGLGSDAMREALAAEVPDWSERSLAEWWWCAEDAKGHLRAWSGEAWWSPRLEKPYSTSGATRVVTDDLGRFRRHPADEVLVLGTWTWFWPGAGSEMGTQAFVDARQRLRFDELLPDSSVKLGGEVYPPERAPYLQWALVARWIPDSEARTAEER